MKFDPKCEADLPHVGVKCPQFSFQRLLGADPVLGVEMSSTGEVACFGEDVEEAYIKSLEASRVPIPQKGSTICAVVNENSDFDQIRRLEGIGYNIAAGNNNSQKLLNENGVCANVMETDNFDMIKKNKFDLVIDMTKNDKSNYDIRRNAIDYNVSLVTNDEQVKLLVRSLEKASPQMYKSYGDYFPECEK